MHRASLSEIVRYCDRVLRTSEIVDYDQAANGLQVENDGRVTRIVALVDASLATLTKATEAQGDLVLVHHGLFWGPSHPWTGQRRQLLKLLLDHNLAVYSSHLPLDAHPRLGNNAQLCQALGWRQLQPFFFEKGQYLGWKTEVIHGDKRPRRLKHEKGVPREVLAANLARVLGAPPKLLPGGPSCCRKIGVVTGGAGSQIRLAAKEGVDTFITGEGPHWTYASAEELGLNVFYGGHYATETFGVKALAATLSARFKIPWQFIDHPTGL